jgi:hypothetical protein
MQDEDSDEDDASMDQNERNVGTKKSQAARDAEAPALGDIETVYIPLYGNRTRYLSMCKLIYIYIYIYI